MVLDRRAELGEFLRSRRARLRPEEYGLPSHGRRRVPGLRREELAQLAGVSVDHYIRLEQGRALHFSAEILDSVARALQLDHAESAHLHRLALPTSAERLEAAGEGPPLRAGIRRLLASVVDAPAYLVDRNTNVLAWNQLASTLLTDFGAIPAPERNMARLVFLDPSVRDLYIDWLTRARDVAGFLRMDAARRPVPASTQALIDELSTASAEFREIWAEHAVRDKKHGKYRYRHPLAGEFELTYETLRLPDDPGLALTVHTAEEGTPAEIALQVLSRAKGAHRPMT